MPAVFRRELDLYANIRPSYVRPGLPSTVCAMNLVFVREKLEDFHVDRNMHLGIGEFMPTPDVMTVCSPSRARFNAYRMRSARPDVAARR